MIRSSRTLLVAYFVAMGGFLALDACWLTFMGPRLYRPQLGGLMASAVDWTAAVLFYVLYMTGILLFAVVPALESGRPAGAVARGAVFGLIAYATYDLTNQATLLGWPWSVTAADLVWGTFASGIAAGLSAWAACLPVGHTVDQ